MNQTANESTRSLITVRNVSAVSPHNKAIYESGKLLLTESISTSREFCKFMISISTGAIPIYLGFLTFLLPKNYTPGLLMRGIIIIPTIGFLISSIAFAIGYIPVATKFSLDVIDEIERAREEVLQHRITKIKVGFATFVLATLTSILVIVASLSLR
jgi:hypothetical protein